MVSNMKRVGASLAAIATAVMLCGVSGPATAGGRHFINVVTDPGAKTNWSVYADLYDGKGRRVYHWQETNKKAGKGSVHWEYTDGGDGGRVHVWVYPSDSQTFSYTNLPLNKNHCYRIGPAFFGPYSTVHDEGNCK